MNHSKFTKGPWYVSESSRNNPIILTEGHFIAELGITNTAEGKAEQQANAKLIATAPEMYSELKLIIDNWVNEKYPEIEDIERIQELISKI